MIGKIIGLIFGIFRWIFGGKSMFGLGGVIKLLFVLVLATTFLKSCSGTHYQKSTDRASTAVRNFDAPVQTPPAFGQPRYFVNNELASRLRIATAAGLNYFVTLIEHSSQKKCLEVFLQGGQDSEIAVPIGDYEIIYAAGTTWYGVENLFGPETQTARVNETASFKRGAVITLNISRITR